jgi:hypothetical protein
MTYNNNNNNSNNNHDHNPNHKESGNRTWVYNLEIVANWAVTLLFVVVLSLVVYSCVTDPIIKVNVNVKRSSTDTVTVQDTKNLDLDTRGMNCTEHNGTRVCVHSETCTDKGCEVTKGS